MLNKSDKEFDRNWVHYLYSHSGLHKKTLRILLGQSASISDLKNKIQDPQDPINHLLNDEKKQKIFRLIKSFSSKPSVSSYPFVTFNDKSYPISFSYLHDPPVLFYYQGDYSLIQANYPKIAIVGTRRASQYAIEVTKNIIQDLIAVKPIIISGMAAGVDGTAHSFALDFAMGSIGVLGTSLDRVYPVKHAKLQKNMADQGLLLTEVSVGALHGPWRFIERNRLIAALADVIIVVEAPEKSGALSTVDFALQLGKEVFVVPGSILHQKNRGGHRLIQQGAHLLSDVEEIFPFLGAHYDSKPEPIKTESNISYASCLTHRMEGLKEEEKFIVTCLQSGQLHVDEIIEKSKRPAAEVLQSLMKLQLEGYIKELSSAFYGLESN